MMLLVSVLLLFLPTEQGSTEPQVSGTELEPGSSVADTYQTLKDEAQAIRREGYDEIGKADLIREQAYQVKEENLERTLVETITLMKGQANETNSFIEEISATLGAVSSRMDRLETMMEDQRSEFEKIVQTVEKVDNSAAEIAAKEENHSSEILKIGKKVEDSASEIAAKVENQSSEFEKIAQKVEESASQIAAKVENQSSEFEKIRQKVEDGASQIAVKLENQSSEFEKIGQKVEKVDNSTSEIAAKLDNQSSEFEEIGQKVEECASQIAAKIENQSREILQVGQKVDDKALEIAAKVKDQSSEILQIGQKVNDKALEITAKVENQSIEILQIGQKVDNRASEIATKVENQSIDILQIGQKVDNRATETQATIETVKNRQKAWISEIRLISHYKRTEVNFRFFWGHDSGLITDGQFTFSESTDNSMRTVTNSIFATPGNKMWIELGGIFRIHKIKIWNIRHCCKGALKGVQIYVDDRLIGTVDSGDDTFDLTVSSGNPTYASRVTLRQPINTYLLILEVQVWGSGPFEEDDKFA